MARGENYIIAIRTMGFDPIYIDCVIVVSAIGGKDNGHGDQVMANHKWEARIH